MWMHVFWFYFCQNPHDVPRVGKHNEIGQDISIRVFLGENKGRAVQSCATFTAISYLHIIYLAIFAVQGVLFSGV